MPAPRTSDAGRPRIPGVAVAGWSSAPQRSTTPPRSIAGPPQCPPGPAAITGPGLAEIKPHHVRGMRSGLAQLKVRLRTHPGHPALWLVTYQPLPAEGGRVRRVRIVAHEVDPARLRAATSLSDPTAFLRCRTVLATPLLPGTMPFPDPMARPALFGLAVEDLVRRAFVGAFPRTGTKGLPAGGERPGPDILWRELADLYREVAVQTGDRYWSDLAGELAGPAV